MRGGASCFFTVLMATQCCGDSAQEACENLAGHNGACHRTSPREAADLLKLGLWFSCWFRQEG